MYMYMYTNIGGLFNKVAWCLYNVHVHVDYMDIGSTCMCHNVHVYMYITYVHLILTVHNYDGVYLLYNYSDIFSLGFGPFR